MLSKQSPLHRATRGLAWGALGVSLFLALPHRAQADRVGQVVEQAGKRFLAGEVLVRVRPGQQEATVRRKLQTLGVIGRRIPALNLYQIRLRPNLAVDAALQQAKRLPEVALVQRNHVYSMTVEPNDTHYLNGRQWGPQKIQMPRAWEIFYPANAPGHPVIIAIIDTGVDGYHQDLANMMLRDSQGAIFGFDSVLGVQNEALPGHWHGTHVAGTAAAQTNNAQGVAGIAGWRGNPNQSDADAIKIMPIRCLDQNGDGTDVTVADGIIWAADHGARVINLSLGDSGTTPTLDDAMAYAWNRGVVNVAAAGNQGSSALFYPAASPNTIGVSATENDADDTIPYWSNRSSDWVTVSAPGSEIHSTMPNNSYQNASGTSMATPHVAGLAALIIAQNPTLTNQQVRNIITSTCRRPSANYPVQFGRVDAYEALKKTGMALAGTITFLGSQRTAFPLTFTFAPDGIGTAYVQTVTPPESAPADTATFTVPGIAPGIYTVTISGEKWLKRKLTIDARANNVLNAVVSLEPGDLNQDNSVDLFDLVQLFDAYGTEANEAGWNARADLNADDAVDLFDLVLLFDHYGSEGD